MFKTNESAVEHVKAIVYSKNTLILIISNYLHQIEGERTADNPERHQRQVHNLPIRYRKSTLFFRSVISLPVHLGFSMTGGCATSNIWCQHRITVYEWMNISPQTSQPPINIFLVAYTILEPFNKENSNAFFWILTLPRNFQLKLY